jgi:hypothetical protein
MATPRYTAEHILEAVVLDVTLATKDVIDVRGFTNLFIYPDSGGSIKYSVVLDEDETTHGPSPVTGSADEIQEIVVAGNFYMVEAITADCHAHPVFLNQGGFDLSVEDEGIEKLSAATILDFKGAGVVVADDGGGQAGITIAGGGAVSVEDEGTELTASVDVIDFVGAGVTVTEPTADEVQVTIPAQTIGPIKDLETSTRSSGDITANGTSWANLDTGLDLVLDAAVGDLVGCGIIGRWENQSSVTGFLDVVSVVGGSPVNAWGSGTTESGSFEGVQAWVGDDGVQSRAGGTVFKTIVSGDLSAGTVTLRLRVRTSSANNKVLNASANQILHFYAINYGQDFDDRIGKTDIARRTAGDLTLNSTTWANLPSLGTLVLDAAIDDVVEVGMSGSFGTEAVDAFLDIGSDVAGIQNVWSLDGSEVAAANGVQAWKGDSGVDNGFGGTSRRKLVSGDISSGQVTLQFRYKTASASNRTLKADSNNPLEVWAKNHGPVAT